MHTVFLTLPSWRIIRKADNSPWCTEWPNFSSEIHKLSTIPDIHLFPTFLNSFTYTGPFLIILTFQSFHITCITCTDVTQVHLPSVYKLYGRFPESHFPGKSLSRKDVSQKDISRIVIFPERRFPDRHFPGKTFPGKTFPGKKLCLNFSW